MFDLDHQTCFHHQSILSLKQFSKHAAALLAFAGLLLGTGDAKSVAQRPTDVDLSQASEMIRPANLSALIKKSGFVRKLPEQELKESGNQQYRLTGVPPGYTFFLLVGSLSEGNDGRPKFSIGEESEGDSLRPQLTLVGHEDVVSMGQSIGDKHNLFEFPDAQQRMAGRGKPQRAETEPMITQRKDQYLLSLRLENPQQHGALRDESVFLCVAPRVPGGFPGPERDSPTIDVSAAPLLELTPAVRFLPPFHQSPAGAWTYTSQDFALSEPDTRRFKLTNSISGPALRVGLLLPIKNAAEVNRDRRAKILLP
ncbi:MAG: hypothetical protein MI861_12895, partial [Pirellulales bacterium]|nr:hypothetical protein [Pirellulales bacterium]